MGEIQFWHMQMHPKNNPEFSKLVPTILEKEQFIGLGDLEEDDKQIKDFQYRVKIGDVIAIKDGEKLIALVEVIGDSEEISDDKSDYGWMKYRRKIKVLYWAEGETLPHTRRTLTICLDESTETAKFIKELFDKIKNKK